MSNTSGDDMTSGTRTMDYFKASVIKMSEDSSMEIDFCTEAKLSINKITFIYITSHSCTIHLSLITITESTGNLLIKYCFELANI